MPKSSNDIFMEHLAARRAPAEAAAAQLIASESYDQAERTVIAVDDSIYGTVALARLYRARLEQIAASAQLRQNREQLLAVYRRALRWAQRSYPEPHTECEADDYERGRLADHAELVRIIGEDPGNHW